MSGVTSGALPLVNDKDAIARVLAQRLSEQLHQSVVVDNKPGAGTVLGVDLAAKSPADGYTLVTVANSFCVNQTLVKNLPYDGLRDLRPVGLMGMSEHVLATHPGSGLKTVADLIAAAKKQPGKLSYASFGAGTSAHLAGAMLEAQAGIEMIHVPYKGQAPALNDLILHLLAKKADDRPESTKVVAGRLKASLDYGQVDELLEGDIDGFLRSIQASLSGEVTSTAISICSGSVSWNSSIRATGNCCRMISFNRVPCSPFNAACRPRSRSSNPSCERRRCVASNSVAIQRAAWLSKPMRGSGSCFRASRRGVIA